MLEVLETHPAFAGFGFDGAIGQHTGRMAADEALFENVKLAFVIGSRLPLRAASSTDFFGLHSVGSSWLLRSAAAFGRLLVEGGLEVGLGFFEGLDGFADGGRQ